MTFDYTPQFGPWRCTSGCVTVCPYRCSECGTNLDGDMLALVTDAGDVDQEPDAVLEEGATAAPAVADGGQIVDRFGGDADGGR